MSDSEGPGSGGASPRRETHNAFYEWFLNPAGELDLAQLEDWEKKKKAGAWLLVHPEAPFRKFWDIGSVFMIIYSCITVPFFLSVHRPPRPHRARAHAPCPTVPPPRTHRPAVHAGLKQTQHSASAFSLAPLASYIEVPARPRTSARSMRPPGLTLAELQSPWGLPAPRAVHTLCISQYGLLLYNASDATLYESIARLQHATGIAWPHTKPVTTPRG